MSKRVCVLLAPGYEEVEALTPVDYIRRAGMDVDVVSCTEDIIVPSAHQVNVACDTFLDDIKAQDYDMVVVPGGIPGVPNLCANDKVAQFLQAMNESGKWVTALCAGPKVLDHAGVLKGRCATCYPGWETKLETIADFKRETVVRDGNTITARGAGAAGYFALALVEALAGKEEADKVKKAVVMDIVERNLGVAE
jgi:4-methyl-5(b-hydroxyethyl)-thiazole monophosphate biosynthesis